MKVVLKFKINQYNVILELVRFQFDFIMLCFKKKMVLHKSMPLQVAIQLSSNTACPHIPDENRLKYKPFQCALNNWQSFFW